MSKKIWQKLTNAELEIMKTVWANDEVTVTHVMDVINAHRAHKLKRTTIQVQMTRLADKGWLTYRKEGRVLFYKGTRGREEVSAEIAGDINTRVFDGAQSELVKSLFEGSKVSREELARIKKLIDEHEES
jgi:BlaI family penicillinase repressor